MDKDWKPVNESGYLINERGDVIDKDGQVRFLEQQLQRPRGILLPAMYTYKGEAVNIRDIIG